MSGANIRWFRTLAAILWVAPIAILVRYWQLWDQLPLRMAAHFNAAGQPNGWMTREMSLYWSAGFLVFMVAIFFVVLIAVEQKYPESKLSWVLLAFLHAEAWTLVYLMDSLIGYNLNRTPITIAPVPIVTVIGLLAVAIVAVGEKRGAALSTSDVMAQEIHGGRKWSLIFLAPAIVLIAIASALPYFTLRLALYLIALVTLCAFAMAWDGFHYFFTRHGVEIRTLGFRLKSIPLLQIKSYEIQKWNAIRGYGIRGAGNCKAYVWGNNGVRVDLYDGSIFLGHNDPQRIVHDLNVIKRYQNS
jgi:Protein of unknown function (DUF1648)